MITGDRSGGHGGLPDRAVDVISADASDVLARVPSLPNNVDLTQTALNDSRSDGVGQLLPTAVKRGLGATVRLQRLVHLSVGHEQSVADVDAVNQGWPP